LLDRLTDLQPDQLVESCEQRGLSLRRLHDSVLRDLGWLLNATSLSSVTGPPACTQVARSVLNYGLRNLAGANLSGLPVGQIEKAIRQAIQDFEPRLMRSTIMVQAAGVPGSTGAPGSAGATGTAGAPGTTRSAAGDEAGRQGRVGNSGDGRQPQQAPHRTTGGGPNKIVFAIEADMWSRPCPERLYLKTEFDIDTSVMRLSESGTDRSLVGQVQSGSH
jgi:type VI secretion system protein ImpF